MSLITVHTIQIDGKYNRGLIALNTGNISVLEEKERKAHFQFIPFDGRIHTYLIEESIDHILNAPVQSDDFNLTFTIVGGTLTVAKVNIMKVYPHTSADRTYIETLSGTTADVHVIKERMLEVVWEVNKVQ